MTAGSRRVLFWTPRILTIAFALFLATFALDVFGEGYTGPQLLLAVVMHLIPTAIVAVVLVLAWRWEWVGTVAFAGVGIYYLRTNLRHPDWILIISGPLFLIGALFLLNWLQRIALHSRPQPR